MWTVSDLAPMRKAFLVEGREVIGDTLKAEGIEVEYIPELDCFPGKHNPYAARDLGFFHGHRFYGHKQSSDFAERHGHEFAEGGEGGAIISDGNLAIITNLFARYNHRRTDVDRLQRELDMEVVEVRTHGPHIDYFINFASSGLVVFNKGLVETLYRLTDLREARESIYKAVERLSRDYDVLEVHKREECHGLHYYKLALDDPDSFHWCPPSMRVHFEMLGNVLPVSDGVVLMVEDFPKDICDRLGWQHIPTELREKGITVYEVPAECFTLGKGHDTGPRCSVLPMKVSE